MPYLTTIRRLLLAGLVLGFVVVVLGAYVRLSAAGLGCPDWPGCYGHFTPAAAQAAGAQADAAPIHVGKAWREMSHRYAALILGLIIVLIGALALRSRRARSGDRVSPVLPLVLVALVIFQGLLGALTVTWQLKPLIVTAHLAFGLLTLSLLFWMWLALRGQGDGPWQRSAIARVNTVGAMRVPGASVGHAGTFTLIALGALFLQILLGGWTSSNYAAVACPDFPTCQAAWLPQADYRDAFVLWRGLGINYEGGVLQHPARVAIHFTHRLGAVVAGIALLLAALTSLRARAPLRARPAALAVLALLGLQLSIGIAMVVKGFPLWIATAHNAGAALLLLATLLLLHALRR